ncbi:hypothetical protein AGMMS50268_15280 [Spirochaetia bacterium]|nr:hypothetical protein AGMMS50268_15280 [Spirochaetia bacterium]
MTVDPKMKSSISSATGPIIASIGTAALVAAVGALIAELLMINFSQSSLVGDKEMHPTKDEMAASSSEVAASEKEGKLAQDTVAGVNGEVKASETEAKAQTGEATAAESGASALRTKAGASDIETKALKMT